MILWNRLELFRKTLFRIFYILGIAFFLTTFLVDHITELLLKPLRVSLLNLEGGSIVYSSIFEKAWVQVDVAIWWAIIFSSPLWFYEIWKFIKLFLGDEQVKAIRPFMILGFVLFATGMCFGYFVAFPFAFKLLHMMGAADIKPTINLRDYISSTSKILLFLGAIFQFPNVLLILGFMGIVNKELLRNFRRYIYIGLSVVAAIFSPPDVFSMLSVWIPLVVLYEVGVLAVAWLVKPKPRQEN